MATGASEVELHNSVKRTPALQSQYIAKPINVTTDHMIPIQWDSTIHTERNTASNITSRVLATIGAGEPVTAQLPKWQY